MIRSFENTGDEKPQIEWGFDTETQDGKAILLTVAGPDGAGVEGKGQAYWHEPVSFHDAFNWLSQWSAWFVAYNMDYDARALIKWIPEKLWRGLYSNERAEWRGFVFTYRGGRYFSVRHGSRVVTIYDLAVFFQKSLALASKELLKRDAKGKIPKSWYPQMAARLKATKTRDRLLRYALDDARAVRDLWLELRTQFQKLGVPVAALNNPVSPGSIAAAFFGEKLRFDIPWDGNNVAKRAYAGGRIEVYRRGYFPKVYFYDLKSAYPWALSKLHDPRDLDYVRDGAERDDFVYAVYKVRVTIPRGVFVPPIPVWHPKKTLRIYPCGSYSAWVTDPEMRLLKRRGWLQEIVDAAYLVGDRKPWLTEIPRLFLQRKKQEGMSQAIKLVLNSVYGKLAQVDTRYGDSEYVGGSARTLPGTFLSKKSTFASTTNFFVSAYVTAMTRLRLWDVMDRFPKNLILAATDGLLMNRPMPSAELGEGLGDWSVQAVRAKAIVVGTGVYSVKYDGHWHDKMRGYRLKEPLREVLKSNRTKIRTTSQIAYTLGDYFMRGSPMNVITEIPRTLNVNFDDKRIWPEDWKRARDLLTGVQVSRPPILLDADAQGRLK